MTRIFISVLLFFVIFNVGAQEQRNSADFDALYQAIRELPSYKDQLKDDASYQQLYETLRKNLDTDNELTVLQKMVQMIMPLRDNHLSFARLPDSLAKYTPSVPKVDLQELRKRFLNVSADSLEGVYYRQNSSYLIYKKETNVYYVQDLTTKELTAILYRNKLGSYDVIQFSVGKYPYVLSRNIKLVNGLLVDLNFIKDKTKTYYNIVNRKEKYEYRMLNAQIGYLSLGTFDASNETIKLATDFFDKIKNEINAKAIIVDVRNNGGGGYKTSRQFINFLANFNGDVYVLQNTYTISNAEQFILTLKERRTIITLGETTRGTITYGNNFGKRITLPSNRFSFYPTDMNGLKKELIHETIGIKPDIYLNPFSEDWVTQTLKQIK